MIGWEEVEVTCNSNDAEKRGEVERGVEIGMCSDTENVPLVAERIWDKLILEKCVWETKPQKYSQMAGWLRQMMVNWWEW